GRRPPVIDTGSSGYWPYRVSRSGLEIQVRVTLGEYESKRSTAEMLTEADARRSLPADLGTESGESRSAATALASPSPRADADTDHESAASSGDERGQALENKAVEPAGACEVREAPLSFLG